MVTGAGRKSPNNVSEGMEGVLVGCFIVGILPARAELGATPTCIRLSVVDESGCRNSADTEGIVFLDLPPDGYCVSRFSTPNSRK